MFDNKSKPIEKIIQIDTRTLNQKLYDWGISIVLGLIEFKKARLLAKQTQYFKDEKKAQDKKDRIIEEQYFKLVEKLNELPRPRSFLELKNWIKQLKNLFKEVDPNWEAIYSPVFTLGRLKVRINTDDNKKNIISLWVFNPNPNRDSDSLVLEINLTNETINTSDYILDHIYNPFMKFIRKTKVGGSWTSYKADE